MPSSATFRSDPANTITSEAALIAACVAAEHEAGVVAVVEVPQASKVTVAAGLAFLTAEVIPCTALTCRLGSPE